MSVFVQQQHSVSSFDKGGESWVILNEIEKSIKRKIESVGTPLKDWDIQIKSGISTGFNDAFIISTEKRDEILSNCKNEEERKKTAELIRPILRGRDIKRYSYDWANLWLVYIPWHFPLHLDNSIHGCSEKAEKEFQKQYPAIYNHLLGYKKQLSARNKAETGYEWYALQRWGANCWEDFSRPKLIYPSITKYLPFVYDDKKFLTNQNCFIVTGKDIEFLTAFLNSSIFKYCFRDAFPKLLGGTRELIKIFFDKIPVLQVTDKTNEKFKVLIKDIQNEYTEQKAKEIDKQIFELYGLNEGEIYAITK